MNLSPPPFFYIKNTQELSDETSSIWVLQRVFLRNAVRPSGVTCTPAYDLLPILVRVKTIKGSQYQLQQPPLVMQVDENPKCRMGPG